MCIRKIRLIKLSAGNSHDAPEVRELIKLLNSKAVSHLLMDRAYEDDKTRTLAFARRFVPVVPPKKNRKTP